MINEDWENAPAVSREYGSMVIDLQTRELTRRNALHCFVNAEKRDIAIGRLLNVWRADRDYPIGPTAGLSVDEIRALVPTHIEKGCGALVRYSDIPEPWATRFQIAAFGSTRAVDGYFACDWEKFLDLWVDEAERINDLVEQEIECQVVSGIRAAQARSRSTLADLGIDPGDLQVWVSELVEKGRWPAGDLLEAFKAWSAKHTSNADPEPGL